MNSLAKTVMGVVLGLMLVLPALAQDAKTAPKAKTLFTNVHVFDGKTENRIMNANVLVEGNMIKAVSTDPIEAGGVTVIDGGGIEEDGGAGADPEIPQHAEASGQSVAWGTWGER